ncbi:hypothetical protein [Streptomyces gardneri]|uniref:hypothetical protein n=1 Tax=Streptomyces gardneri TaxID=66892 RepID=UPI0035D730A2
MTEAATPITHPDRAGHTGRGGWDGSPCAGIVHDPQALLDDTVPLDRAVHERLVDTVLTWRENSTVLPSADLDQISLQLTGYGRLLIRETKAACGRLPQTDPAVPLARGMRRGRTPIRHGTQPPRPLYRRTVDGPPRARPAQGIRSGLGCMARTRTEAVTPVATIVDEITSGSAFPAQ